MTFLAKRCKTWELLKHFARQYAIISEIYPSTSSNYDDFNSIFITTKAVIHFPTLCSFSLIDFTYTLQYCYITLTTCSSTTSQHIKTSSTNHFQIFGNHHLTKTFSTISSIRTDDIFTTPNYQSSPLDKLLSPFIVWVLALHHRLPTTTFTTTFYTVTANLPIEPPTTAG